MSMDPIKDRVLKRVTWVVTAVAAGLLLTADYGPQPHALSTIQKSLHNLKEWFWTPSKVEVEQLQRSHHIDLDKRDSSTGKHD
ncbi:hypothetical protein O6H91_05G122700 [Diphasiastrum complanatum]|uniref:Uncharacterized protein n=1 Tax=Diphasiastrum complanatum TaxID=34168 RepID=A0ACC2DSZ1_DIPCM|nr:hypothetical protein O6H91_05G122700 [Diphasiastrum complanatum]